jgi:hypothetical protein
MKIRLRDGEFKADEPNATQFAEVAETIAGGPAPEWLALGLEYFSFFVGGRKLPARAEEIRDDVQMLAAADYLFDNLRVYLHLADPPFELFDYDENMEHVEHVIDHLDEVMEFLQKRIAEVPSRAGGPTPDGRMLLCAAVVGEGYRLVHNRPEIEPFSPAVGKACEAYWQACDNEPTGKKHQGEPRNWQPHLTRYRASGDKEWIRSRFERYQDGEQLTG